MIELRNISKTFHTDAGEVRALRDVSLRVNRGEIYGVIGYSGAGKSTLVRCINLLERPDSGQVLIDGKDITGYSQKELETVRTKIGMIFQHFNLLRSQTVYDNVAFVLKYLKWDRKRIRSRVEELLEIVDLRDKANVYPSQLSGGQQQRVAIARALASDPQILLCDEATSALDPQTTDSILELLADLNRRLGLTIVMITHQMSVIQKICSQVAVMQDGQIVERGTAFQIFSSPREEITKKFVTSVFHGEDVQALFRQNALQQVIAEGGRVYHLLFVGEDANNSYICTMIKHFQLDVSIIYGSIELIQGRPIGSLYIAVQGAPQVMDAAIRYLEQNRIEAGLVRERPDENGRREAIV